MWSSGNIKSVTSGLKFCYIQRNCVSTIYEHSVHSGPTESRTRSSNSCTSCVSVSVGSLQPQCCCCCEPFGGVLVYLHTRVKKNRLGSVKRCFGSQLRAVSTRKVWACVCRQLQCFVWKRRFRRTTENRGWKLFGADTLRLNNACKNSLSCKSINCTMYVT